MKNKFILLILGTFILVSVLGVGSSLAIGQISAEDETTDGATVSGYASFVSSEYDRVYLGLQYKKSSSSTWLFYSGSFRWVTPISGLQYITMTGLDDNTNYDWRFVVTEYEIDDLGYSMFQAAPYYYTFTTLSSYIPHQVDTLIPQNIGTNTVRLRGEIDLMGDNSFLVATFAYRVQGGSWIFLDDTNQYEETVHNVGIFYYDLSGLTSGTNYDYEAFAYSTAGGWEDGGVVSFSTLSNPTVVKPTVTLSSASLVDENSAVLNANLGSLGDYTEVDLQFFYKKNGIVGAIAPISASVQTKTNTGSYTYTLTGLSDGITYEYDVGYYDEEENQYILTYSPVTFTTTEIIPEWLNTTKQNLTSAQVFNESISGLESGTSYTFRACYEIDTGFYCNDTLTFTTSTLSPPSVTTLDATSIINNQVVLNGQLTSLGDFTPVSVGFSVDYGSGSVSIPYNADLTSTGTFSYTLTGLTPETTYSYKAVAYSVGDYLVEGSPVQFTTSATALFPPVEINPISNYNMNFSDTLSINVNDYYDYYDDVVFNIEGYDILEGDYITFLDDNNTLVVSMELNNLLNNFILSITSFEVEKNYTVDYTVTNSQGNKTGTFDLKIIEGVETGENGTNVTDGDSLVNTFLDWVIGLFPDSESMTSTQKITFVIIFLLVVTVICLALTITITKTISVGMIYFIMIVNLLFFFFFITLGYVPIGFLIALALGLGIIGFFKVRGGM